MGSPAHRPYPAAWQVRYDDEFAAFLEDEPSTLGAIVNVAASAIRERVGGDGVQHGQPTTIARPDDVRLPLGRGGGRELLLLD
jgi:hypothetical protein